ncbi:DUF305 domain-containing protein [Pantoea sp. EKM20T]|uniref:CopM family metallochaperone n=1 Tax=Pantoea sp. EKM20T TaxID=2708059 RepID=UPI00142D7E28|nr:DUF305 domain-containing protein [Pantoea sp. EKM20T]KAF6677138.1 DUF305 domain-containing protein [Pantoea sp. EKM20T]
MRAKNIVLAGLLAVLPVTVMAQKPAMDMQSQTGMSSSSQAYMSGMSNMHKSMMAAIKDPDADKAFAKGMIEHHKGAISMAETELKYGKDPEMRKMAEDIIKAQKTEIEHMEGWLKK